MVLRNKTVKKKLNGRKDGFLVKDLYKKVKVIR